MLDPIVSAALLDPGNINIKPGLERMYQVLAKLENPQNNYKVIHITGTNGKGSTAAFIATGLIHSGYKVGKFTSPHIVKINECISINNHEICNEDIERIYFILEQINREYKINSSPFEILTLIMFYYMAEQKVDYLVLEVGMGGINDCTNVVDSIYSIITNISLEHTKWLGNTLDEIAVNKAGIIKNGKTIVADNSPELLVAVAAKTKNFINVLEKYPIKIELDGENLQTIVTLLSRSHVKTTKSFKLGLYGEFQAYNFLIAYEVLRDLGISEENIADAAEHVFIPYRLQIITRKPLVIFDIAHNRAGAVALVKTFSGRYNKDDVIILTTILNDKDIRGMLENFGQIASTIILCTIQDNPRSTDTKELSKYADGLFKQQYVINDARQALEFAKSLTKTVLVTGSSYIFKELFYQSTET